MSPNTPRKIPQDMPRAGEQHPQEWRDELNPDVMAGQNVGLAGPHPEKRARTAHDLKSLHARLRQFMDDDLKQIPVLPQGSRLEQGATYIDLNNLERGEFTATGDMEAGPDNWYVPKTEVPYGIWNGLVGLKGP
jgi:hypothetical protein